ncbi:hypothetical protein SCOCK_130145 [Actinacidiphila cocklensis]|uniref:Uncharacterized protein n=1 Tax=Actinacidiphila cocklensis TaxID=887465 RepID=A0A9W4DI26_9ACTN|nr:hypothetical protein SCOCK_130145 [Actinacidiphila cocklensis]
MILPFRRRRGFIPPIHSLNKRVQAHSVVRLPRGMPPLTGGLPVHSLGGRPRASADHCARSGVSPPSPPP